MRYSWEKAINLIFFHSEKKESKYRVVFLDGVLIRKNPAILFILAQKKILKSSSIPRWGTHEEKAINLILFQPEKKLKCQVVFLDEVLMRKNQGFWFYSLRKEMTKSCSIPRWGTHEGKAIIPRWGICS